MKCLLKCPYKLILFAAVILVTASCATSYRVDVTGYSDPVRSSALVPGRKVFVVHNPEADNPLLEKEVASKIATLLEQEGYRVSSNEDVGFRLTFNYGMDRGPVRIGSIRRPQTIKTYDPDTGKTSYTSVDTYEPLSVQYFTRSLSVRVIDGHKFRESGQKEVVWAADTLSEGKSADLRDVLNYLLVATFEYFGQDTGKAISVRLTPTDSRIVYLKGK
ncbi:MAG: hypothetical protein BBJ60_04255 [Desulfobacterales bacterium S7086C20]|nr:MAG: hypothetical protein BBJ60_04255 [Desulfobacterales bacterium S7086C20]